MTKIDIVGLGPGPGRYLTLETRDLLLSDIPVYLRTAIHPTVAELKSWGCAFSSFDSLYEQAEDFDKLYQKIIQHLLAEAKAHGQIVYAVPGNPLVAETTVKKLLEERDSSVEIKIHTAVSCLDVIFESLKIDPTDGLHLLDGLSLELKELHLDQPLLITQVYSQAIANEVKLTLLERLAPEFAITVIRAAGCDDEQKETISLKDLDRLDWIDHLTSVFVPAGPIESHAPLEHLRHIIAQLRNPEGGCPWDLKQDHDSLRRFVLEEAYEVVSAIESEDPEALCEELGDLLLQVYLHAQVAQDHDDFDLDEVARGICDKLIYRHPHVFGDTSVEDIDEVKQRWEELKAREKAEKGLIRNSILDDLPGNMPALAMSEKIGKIVARVGFDWPVLSGVIDKIDEELTELKEACELDEPEAIMHELGDTLFTLVNLARWFKLDPEDALRQTNRRFARRFQAMEKALNGQPLSELSAEKWEFFWQRAKNEVG